MGCERVGLVFRSLSRSCPDSGNGREPDDTIGEGVFSVSENEVSESAVQLVKRMRLAQDDSRVRPPRLVPACGKGLEVLAIEGNEDALSGCRKSELVVIGQAEISCIPGRHTIHALFSQHPAQGHGHVFVKVEPHWTPLSKWSAQAGGGVSSRASLAAMSRSISSRLS